MYITNGVVSVSAAPFEHAVDGVLAVASLPAYPGVPILFAG